MSSTSIVAREKIEKEFRKRARILSIESITSEIERAKHLNRKSFDQDDIKNDFVELYLNEERNGFLNSAEEDVAEISKFEITNNFSLMIVEPIKEAAKDLPSELNKHMSEWFKHRATIRAM